MHPGATAGRRSASENAAIIAESCGAGDTVCAVARRHGLTPQQPFAWRRLARQSAMASSTMFVPVVVEPEPARKTLSPRRARCRRSRSDGIELEIAGEHRRQKWTDLKGGQAGTNGDQRLLADRQRVPQE